jgi:3-hydroxyacyl-CoA dehydrogenase/enoyl-CoA hydratase/3-hydroxybutyryl-CoA epimerase
VVGDGYGFYTTRVFSAYLLEAAQLVAEGHDPVLVERAAQQLGMVVPPLKVIDEVTLTLVRHGLEQGERYGFHALQLPGGKLLMAMVDEHERFGKAHGAGFYEYGEVRRLWPGLKELVDAEPDETGMAHIAERLMLAQIAQVGRTFDDGILKANRDAEVGAIFGIGFAPQTGGPLAWIDRQGIASVVERMEAFAERYGERFRPAERFRAMAASGERFFPEPEPVA